MLLRWKYFLGLLILVNTFIFFVIFSFPDENLHLIACDVGQGDALVVLYKNTQILFDGGPNNKVVECLSKFLPFWDRKIEAVVLTHPQRDHYLGLIEIFKKYKVENLISTKVGISSQDFEVLKKEVGGNGSRVIDAVRGKNIRFGLIYLDILWPSEEFLALNLSDSINDILSEGKNQNLNSFPSYPVKEDVNEFSIVSILKFKNFEALFTGDASKSVGERLLSVETKKDLDYIKMPHHGSINSAYKEFIEIFSPDLAVISVGKNNSYGHPHKEVLDFLREKNVNVLRTDELGDVVLESDGNKYFFVR